MKNKFEFDWNIVAKLDPSYLLYLEDIFKIQLDEDVARWVDPDSEDVPAPLQQAVANAAGLDEDWTTNQDWRKKDLSEEEQSIIDMTHNDAEKGGVTAASGPLRCDKEADNDEKPEPRYRLKAEYQEYPIQEHPKVLMIMPPKRVLAIGSEFRKGDINYRVNGSNERNTDVVWLVKQKMYFNQDKVGLLKATYRFDRLHDATSELKKNFRMVVYNLKTAKLYYIHGQSTGKYKRITKSISQVGLNKNGVQGALSVISEDFAAQFVKVIRNHVIELIPDAYIPDPPVRKQRAPLPGKVIRISSKVLDIINSSEYRSDVLYAMMLQHKVGCRLEWLADENFINNIVEFAGYPDLFARLEGTAPIVDGVIRTGGKDAAIIKQNTAIKSKTIYTVFSKLRQRPGAKTVTRALFGPWHKNIYHKLMTWEDEDKTHFTGGVIGFLMDLSYVMGKGILPTDAYHLIVRLVKRGDSYARKHLMQMHNIFDYLRGNIYNPDLNDTPSLEKLKQVTLYTRTLTKFLNIKEAVEDGKIDITKLPDTAAATKYYNQMQLDTNQPLLWPTFHDMVNMAQALGIRLRINKFTCAADVRRLHDRFAAFQQRDLEAFNKYDGFEFLKFEAPTKEYGGFKFIQLTTPADLVEEGRVMHHCIGGYSNRCLEGTSIVFSMFKERSWVTIELTGLDMAYGIRQQYTIKDFTVQNQDMLDTIDKWHDDIVNMHRNDEEVYATKARKSLEYQKNLAQLKKYEAMGEDDMSSEERKWLTQAIENVKRALEGSVVKMELKEVPDATTFEQALTPA